MVRTAALAMASLIDAGCSFIFPLGSPAPDAGAGIDGDGDSDSDADSDGDGDADGDGDGDGDAGCAEPGVVGAKYDVGTYWDVVVDDDVAYVAQGAAGCDAYDVLQPDQPTWLGGVVTAERHARRIGLLDADHVVVAWPDLDPPLDDSLVSVVDVSDPSRPELTGALLLTMIPADLAVSGQWAYLALEDAGLGIVDLADPTVPEMTAQLPLDGCSAQGVAVDGDHAYLACAGGGMTVVELSPELGVSGHLDFERGQNAVAVSVSGTHAFVAQSGAGLQVVDVTDAEAPWLTGALDGLGTADSIAVSGSWAILSTIQADLLFIDVSIPEAPILGPSLRIGRDRALGVFASPALIYVAAGDSGLFIVDRGCTSEP